MYEWTLEQNINDGENIAVARGQCQKEILKAYQAVFLL